MNSSDLPNSEVYRYPHYYAIGYQWNTKAECDFIESCAVAYMDNMDPAPAKGERVSPLSMLDIGCGSGRHMLELSSRKHKLTGFDLRPEMVEFVREKSAQQKLAVNVSVGDLHYVPVSGKFDIGICLMDTFRFLLTNEDITRHLKLVAEHLNPGGLYITDFWIPSKWDQISNEIYQWEQTEGDTTVKVFYLQHPDSVDPVSQTFEDELVFVVGEGEQSKEIRGGRTRTRLIMPQEYRALVEASRAFDFVDAFSEFSLQASLDSSPMSWRMISVLKKKA